MQQDYRRDVDGLRAVAVLAVMVFHAWPNALGSGFIGVDIFFVISGFLITGIILKDIRRGRFSFADFYVRRFRRIWPAFLLVLLACFGLGVRLMLADELESLCRHLRYGAVFLSNFLLVGEAGYFDLSMRSKPLLHLWSLAVEEQFYLVWPATVLLFARARIKLVYPLIAIIGASFIFNIYSTDHLPRIAFFHLPGRMWELLVGGALANGEGSLKRIAPRIRDGLSIAATLLMVVSLATIKEGAGFPGHRALGPTLAAALFIAAGQDAIVNRTLLSVRPMAATGLISYPLYLWHWPLLVFGKLANIGPAPALIAAVVLSIATYRLIELPIRGRITGRAALKKYLGIPAVALAANVAIALGTWWGLRSVAEAKPGPFEHVPRENVECRKLPGIPQSERMFCVLSQGFAEPSVAILGDSHASHLFPGFAQAYAQRGQGVVALGTESCPPFADEGYDNSTWIDQATCISLMQQITRYVKESASIKTVIVSFYLQDCQWHWKADGGDVMAVVASRLRAYVESLKSAGKNVILVEDVPPMWVDPHACFKRSLLSGVSDIPSCPVDQDQVTNVMRGYESFFAQPPPSVCYFPTERYFVSDGRYTMVKDDQLLYLDQNHLNIPGSLYLGRQFEKSSCF